MKEFELDKQQKKAVESTDNKILVISGAGGGKAQPVDTVIPTPTGYKKLKDLKINDYVFDRQGKPTKVLQIFPQGKKEVYKVTTKDGRQTECCKEHLWSYNNGHGKLTTQPLETIIQRGLKKSDNTLKFKIPMNKAVDFPTQNLPIDPYVLGCFLGDGCNTLDYLTISSENDETPNKICSILKCNVYKNPANYNWAFFYYNTNGKKDYIKTKDFFEKTEEVYNYCLNKSIPQQFLIGDKKQRLELLRGLLDTDGSIENNKKANVTFSSNSKQLALDVFNLCYSLGIRATLRENDRKNKKNIEYTVFLGIKNKEKPTLFKLQRKINIANRYINYENKADYNWVGITKIEKLEEKKECLCILVDNEEHLYLTNNFIVTHNTKILIERIKFLLDSGAEPSDIAVITYTNMAVGEILNRISIGGFFVGTIHAYAANCLRKTDGYDFSWFSGEENQFDRLLEEAVDYCAKPPIKYLLIDEFQDISNKEYAFIRAVEPESFFYVGDDFQAIYGFKGGNVDIFKGLYYNKEVKTFLLENNYRNQRKILNTGNAYIDKIKKTQLIPKESFVCNTEEVGDVNLATVSQAVISAKMDGNYNNWMFLARTNDQVWQIKQILDKYNIPNVSFKKSELTYEELQKTLESNTVLLLTIHSAKGLERDNVVIHGMRMWNDEELKVNYVGATRAKKQLIICSKLQ